MRHAGTRVAEANASSNRELRTEGMERHNLTYVYISIYIIYMDQ